MRMNQDLESFQVAILMCINRINLRMFKKKDKASPNWITLKTETIGDKDVAFVSQQLIHS